jgi:hypothetical protein
VEQLVRRAQGEKNCRLLLISTAGDFTDECKRYAEEHGVVLLGGTRFAQAILPYLGT